MAARTRITIIMSETDTTRRDCYRTMRRKGLSIPAAAAAALIRYQIVTAPGFPEEGES